jgi:hypothetical protein
MVITLALFVTGEADTLVGVVGHKADTIDDAMASLAPCRCSRQHQIFIHLSLLL